MLWPILRGVLWRTAVAALCVWAAIVTASSLSPRQSVVTPPPDASPRVQQYRTYDVSGLIITSPDADSTGNYRFYACPEGSVLSIPEPDSVNVSSLRDDS